MAGFVDVVLRGLILVLTSVALGGVAWLRFVLRAEPHVKPDAPTALALRAMAAAGAGAALAQATVVLVGLASVADAHGTWPLAAFFETTFALTASARVMLAAAVAALALTMTRRAAPRGAWTALAVTATLLVASSAVVSHAVARVEWRAPLIALDAAHQVAAALWVGGLAHLVLLGVAGYASPPIDVGAVARRFSTLAFRAMAAIVLAGLALTFAYVGDLAAFGGTGGAALQLRRGRAGARHHDPLRGGVAHLAAAGGGRDDRSGQCGRGGRALRPRGAAADEPADRRAAACGRSADGPAGRAQARGARVVGVQPPLGGLLRGHHGRPGDPPLPRRAGGAPLAARVPGARDVPLRPQRSARVAARPRRLLGEPHPARRAPAPHLRPPRRRLRSVRMDGAHEPAGGAAVGLRVPVAVRGGRRAPADALARDVQPEGGVPHRGHPRAARDPRRVRGLGPVARGATAGGGPRARLDLARLLHC